MGLFRRARRPAALLKGMSRWFAIRDDTLACVMISQPLRDAFVEPHQRAAYKLAIARLIGALMIKSRGGTQGLKALCISSCMHLHCRL